MSQRRSGPDKSGAPLERRPRARRAGSKAISGAARSNTTAQLAESLSKVYDPKSAVTDRVLVAGLLLRVRELLLRELDAVLGRHGTSHARFQVLSIICRDHDGLQLREIAAQAAVHPTTMTATIDRLERDGLIERRADPTDRRAILAVATDKGHDVYEQARAELVAIEYGLSDVDLATITSLGEGLDALAAVLEARDPT